MLPDNQVGRFIQGRLDSEYERLLEAPSTIGTSLLVVARKRAVSNPNTP
jgi:hypothetical protein